MMPLARRFTSLVLTCAAVAVLATGACDRHRPGDLETSQTPASTASPSPVVKVGASGAATAARPVEAAQPAQPHPTMTMHMQMSMSGSEAEAGHCNGMAEGEHCQGGCNQWDQAADQVARREVPANAVWQTIGVKGMHCGGCERRIIANVGKLAGVLSVEADAELGKVRVASLPGTDVRKAAIDRINSLGYHAE